MITIPRFEIKPLQKGERITINRKTTVAIKDHKDDALSVILNFEDNLDTNNELAAKIIETIEEYIDENGSEN